MILEPRVTEKLAWTEYKDRGLRIRIYPHDDVNVGDEQVMFDKNYEFTRHLVTAVEREGDDRYMVIGPAMLWPREEQ